MQTHYPISQKLNICPHCHSQKRGQDLRGSAERSSSERFQALIAELRREFQYDARPDQALPEAV